MLMNIESSISQSIVISLTFDNGKNKKYEISVGDLCSFEFNKNGRRKMIEGKVIKIFASETVDSKSWYIVVDGSLDFAGQTERFCPNNILDMNIIQKHDAVQYISSPNDSTRVTDIKLDNGVLMVSIDGGYSWFVPKLDRDRQYDDSCGMDRYPKDPPRHHCHCHCNHRRNKPIVIENDDDYSDDDIIEDENY